MSTHTYMYSILVHTSLLPTQCSLWFTTSNIFIFTVTSTLSFKKQKSQSLQLKVPCRLWNSRAFFHFAAIKRPVINLRARKLWECLLPTQTLDKSWFHHIQMSSLWTPSCKEEFQIGNGSVQCLIEGRPHVNTRDVAWEGETLLFVSSPPGIAWLHRAQGAAKEPQQEQCWGRQGCGMGARDYVPLKPLPSQSLGLWVYLCLVMWHGD